MDRKNLEAMKAAVSVIRNAVEDGFYGSITLKIESGQVKLVERHETLRLDNVKNPT